MMLAQFYDYVTQQNLGDPVKLPFVPERGLALCHHNGFWRVDSVQAIIPKPGSKYADQGVQAFLEVGLRKSVNARWTDEEDEPTDG